MGKQDIGDWVITQQFPQSEAYFNVNKPSRARKIYLTGKEKRQVIAEVGDAGCVLMDYYLSVSGRKHFVITDEKAARALGWKKTKARDVRLKLTKAGWFFHRKTTKGVVTHIYYLGKNCVANRNLSVDERRAKESNYEDVLAIENQRMHLN